ncbi:hypothetical protein FE257_007213 [Aspergillus nanangensis]|uniref:F-box domain-containing protein n=1 Tax=Aspergillus nanangensis TaxID=2582783 RepID=A0AAD4CPN3_ASPNN|nr:hypothetical protein FE257_007213 [Aspergillus nanangensis]
MNLLDLPTEILEQIASECDENRDRSDLRSLSLTSQRLRDIAQPVLFGSFYNTILKGGDNLIPYTKQVLAHPDLALRVHRLEYDPEEGHLSMYKKEHALPLDELVPLVKETDLAPEWDRDEWLKDLRNGEGYAYLLLLASRARNIHSLTINMGLDGFEGLDPLFTRNAGPKSPYLGNCRDLIIQDFKDHALRGERMENLSKFIQLPTLRYLRFHGFTCKHQTAKFDDLVPQSSIISEILFYRSIVDTDRTKDLAMTCRSLKTFVFTGDPQRPRSHEDDHMRADEKQFHSSEVPYILQSHKNTLKTLILDLDPGNATRNSTIQDIPRISTLADFTQLTFLSIEEFAMPRFVENLPSSLTHLVLVWCSTRIVEILEDLKRACRTHLTSLKYVRLECTYQGNVICVREALRTGNKCLPLIAADDILQYLRTICMDAPFKLRISPYRCEAPAPARPVID